MGIFFKFAIEIYAELVYNIRVYMFLFMMNRKYPKKEKGTDKWIRYLI